MNLFQVLIVLILFSWVCVIYQFFQGEFLASFEILLIGIILKIAIFNVWISQE
jgi:hypothetical protein